MRERLILLEASVRGDLEVIDELFSALGRPAQTSGLPLGGHTNGREGVGRVNDLLY